MQKRLLCNYGNVSHLENYIEVFVLEMNIITWRLRRNFRKTYFMRLRLN